MGLQNLWSQVSTYGADTDTLMRQAQTGDLRAYKELMRRGEMLPPPDNPAGRYGRHGRPGASDLRSNRGPEGLGLKYMPAIEGGQEAPSYLGTGLMSERQPSALEEGRGEQNMMRGAEPTAPAGLPFMPAIFPQQEEAPDYLGTGLMTQSTPLTGQQKVSALANGNDAAGAIQAGSAAADEVAGVASATETLPAPIKSLANAFAAEDEDPYEKQTADVIKDLLGGINPEKNKNMALAQAGFAMAASGSPYFFQGIGKGGEAGLKAYNEAEAQDMEARVRAAQLGGDLSKTRETKRSNRAQEGLEGARNVETATHNRATEQHDAAVLGETKRNNTMDNRIQQQQVTIQQQNAQTAAGNLKVAQDQVAETKRQFDKGFATAEELRKAQIKAQEAATEASKALSLDRTTDLYVGEDDVLYSAPKAGGKATVISGPDGQPLKVKPKSSGETAAQKNAKYYTDIGLFASEKDAAAAMLQGKSMTPDRRIAKAYDMADAQLANHPEYIGDDADAAREQWANDYYELLGGDSAPGGGAPQPKTTTTPKADTPPVAGAKKAGDGKWYVPDPSRPGKYLQVQ